MAKKIAIIGAGPAGMMAAYFAAEGGAQVHLYDKNPVVGKKLIFVPWDGCEITHKGDTEDFMENYARGAEFIRYSLDRFGCKDAEKFFKKLGIKLTTDENGVVSPASGQPSEIQKAFEKTLKELGVNFCASSKVQEVIAKGKVVVGIKVHTLIKEFDKIIVATGGAARPKLGASEDGYRFARDMGHSVVEPKPAMTEVETEERLGRHLHGLKFSPTTIAIYYNQSKLLERRGSVIFTDHGLTGDAILFLSGMVARLADKNKVQISIDLFPQTTKDQLESQLKAESSLAGRSTVGEVFKKLVPQQMMPILTRFCRIHENKPMNHITNLERKGLLLFLKDFRVTVKRVKPFSEALYTSGGVSTEEINPKSMESKLVKGLYFCGEVLDVEGGPGGYNLHSAFATGLMAGKSAARGVKSRDSEEEGLEHEVIDKEEIKEKAPAAELTKPTRKRSSKKATTEAEEPIAPEKKTAKKPGKKKAASSSGSSGDNEGTPVAN